MAASEIFEFRGVDNLVYAEVLEDTKTSYRTGDVRWLSPVAEIGRTTESSSESHYYDNKPMIVINSVGSDELTLTVAPLDLATYAEITGQRFDENTGSLIEGNRTNKYFAIGYRTKGTDGKYRYVWRYKGQFGIPDETNATEDDGTDTNNTELTWTGVSTVHEFEKFGESAKALICDERYNALDVSTFFDIVNTPDTLNGTGLPKVRAVHAYPTPTGVYEGHVYVNLVCETSQATIYYTVDGSNPTTDSKIYTKPIKITQTTSIKAIASAPSMASSMQYLFKYDII